MRKQYSAPIVEKVVFDYRVQISTGSKKCSGSVINQTDGQVECASGSPFYFGWNNENPGGIGGGN